MKYSAYTQEQTANSPLVKIVSIEAIDLDSAVSTLESMLTNTDFSALEHQDGDDGWNMWSVPSEDGNTCIGVLEFEDTLDESTILDLFTSRN